MTKTKEIMTRTNVNNQIAISRFYATDQTLKNISPYTIMSISISPKFILSLNDLFGGVLLQGINVLLTSPK